MISAYEKYWPFRTTQCFQVLRKSVKRVCNSLEKTYRRNLQIIPLRPTLPKPLEVSKIVDVVSIPLSKEYFLC